MKALFVIAQHDFQDYEYSEPRKVLEAAGHEIHVASTSVGGCVGAFGDKVNSDITIADAVSRLAEWDAVIFIGGAGVGSLFGDNNALQLAKNAFKAKNVKALAAICWAPVLLARAGVIDGFKVTGWDDGEGTQLRQLKAAGATLLPQHVVEDGKIITADGPPAAKDFGKAIAKLLR